MGASTQADKSKQALTCKVLACVAAGQLISRLTSDCYAITRCIATNVNVALRNLLQVIGELQQWPDTPRLF